MAKRGRGKTKRKSSKSKAINLVNLGESLLVGNVVTQGLFNSNMWDFFTAGTVLNQDTPWTAQGTSTISFRELIGWPGSATAGAGVTSSRLDVISENIRNNGVMMVMSLVGVKVGGKFLKKQLRPTFTQVNKLIEMGGMQNTVRV